MSIKWKEPKTKGESWMSAWAENELNKPLKEIIKEHPKKYVEKVERWCDFNNAETVGNKKNINEHLNKKSSQFLKNFLIEKNLKNFDRKLLLKELNADIYTDGSLQMKILSLFVCKGIVKKHKIEFKDKKGNIKLKLVFSVNEYPEQCPYLKNDKCSFNWEKNSNITKYFSNQNKND